MQITVCNICNSEIKHDAGMRDGKFLIQAKTKEAGMLKVEISCDKKSNCDIHRDCLAEMVNKIIRGGYNNTEET